MFLIKLIIFYLKLYKYIFYLPQIISHRKTQIYQPFLEVVHSNFFTSPPYYFYIDSICDRIISNKSSIPP